MRSRFLILKTCAVGLLGLLVGASLATYEQSQYTKFEASQSLPTRKFPPPGASSPDQSADEVDASEQGDTPERLPLEDEFGDKLVFRLDPKLRPEEVVELQMIALQAAAKSPDGFSLCYRFASPANRNAVGAADEFEEMLWNLFRPLIGHLSRVIGRPVINKNVAEILVTGVGSDGRFMGYRFVVIKQSSGPFVGCWMTDMVVPVIDPDEDDQTPGKQTISDLSVANAVTI